jgi:hypothetical protein
MIIRVFWDEMSKGDSYGNRRAVRWNWECYQWGLFA